jgi:hypothetical protein
MPLWGTNRKVYGAHESWKAAVRAGLKSAVTPTAR